ncbi:hypothetical protein [Flavobacterium flavipallidum]|uniref:Fibronectin type-III domain-containing protein n=1 Tax=Flavobacterium flavipallidum TaxID=3139140 RepID=A0ABU9HKE2_9FLAO
MKKGINVLLLLFLVVCACSSGSSSVDPVSEENNNNLGVLATISTNEAESILSTEAVIWGKIENNGGTSVTERGICYSKQIDPEYEDSKSKANLVMGSGDFKSSLKNLDGETVYYARAYAVNKKGIAYGNQVSFKTTDIASPLLVFGRVKVAGAQDIFLDVELKEHGDLTIQEIGVVYGTSREPTVANSKIKRTSIESKFKQRITGLTPETIYYVRPYAITSQKTLYGQEFAISTIRKGNFTYSFNQNGADAATVTRIKAAFDLATTYYNNFTSIVKHVTVNYSPGTPTADANFAGWINMGSNVGYQKAGTAMHEMAHSVGVGTHTKYWELMTGGTWDGTRANEILQMMTNDPTAVVKGDNTHFWPYGVNGAHEDDGSDFLYMMNALILQGMKTDGMPSN